MPLEIRTRWLSPLQQPLHSLEAEWRWIGEIEQHSFQNPWGKEEFYAFLSMKGHEAILADHLGYLYYELLPRKIRVVNIAVHKDFRRFGVGRKLLACLAEKLTHDDRRNRITVDVRESNLAGHLFLKACGFEAVQVLRNHCLDNGEDAYRFCFRAKANQRITSTTF